MMTLSKIAIKFTQKCSNRLGPGKCCFVQLSLNEADIIKSSSILVYEVKMQNIYTCNEWLDAISIIRI
jgi:hypothetical protein